MSLTSFQGNLRPLIDTFFSYFFSAQDGPQGPLSLLYQSALLVFPLWSQHFLLCRPLSTHNLCHLSRVSPRYLYDRQCLLRLVLVVPPAEVHIPLVTESSHEPPKDKQEEEEEEILIRHPLKVFLSSTFRLFTNIDKSSSPELERLLGRRPLGLPTLLPPV